MSTTGTAADRMLISSELREFLYTLIAEDFYVEGMFDPEGWGDDPYLNPDDENDFPGITYSFDDTLVPPPEDAKYTVHACFSFGPPSWWGYQVYFGHEPDEDRKSPGIDPFEIFSVLTDEQEGVIILRHLSRGSGADESWSFVVDTIIRVDPNEIEECLNVLKEFKWTAEDTARVTAASPEATYYAAQTAAYAAEKAAQAAQAAQAAEAAQTG